VINRRALLGLLAGAIMTPEGLWVPGQKTIILPAKEDFQDTTACRTGYTGSLRADSAMICAPWVGI
jgi:hypothetical protein